MSTLFCFPSLHLCASILGVLILASTGEEGKLKIEVLKDLLSDSKNLRFSYFPHTFSVWQNPKDPSKEDVLGLVHQHNGIFDQADDATYVQVFREAEGDMLPRARVNISCPSAIVNIPPKGPFIYEGRKLLWKAEATKSGTMVGDYKWHEECSCTKFWTEHCTRALKLSYYDGEEKKHSQLIVDSIPVTIVDFYNDPLKSIQEINQKYVRDEEIQEKTVLWMNQDLILNQKSSHNGNRSLGCCEDYDGYLGDIPGVFDMIQSNCTVKDGLAEGKWIAVERGGCSLTAKYKMAIASGAHGLLLVDHGRNFLPQGEKIVSLFGELSLLNIKLVFLSSRDGQVLEDFFVSKRLPPDVAVSSPFATASFQVKQGIDEGVQDEIEATAGLRVYDAYNPSRFQHYPDLFEKPAHGLIIWMEVSEVRDVLFVCAPKSDSQDGGWYYYGISVFDISDPLTAVKKLDSAPPDWMGCGSNDNHEERVIDVNVAEAKWCEGTHPRPSFMTIILDPFNNNDVHYFDSSNLLSSKGGTWRHLNSIRAEWEHSSDGLGEVKLTKDFQYQLFSWQCDSRSCGKSFGDRLYWVAAPTAGDPTCLPSSAEPWTLGKPTPERYSGSTVRDISCSKEGICLVAMSFDGVIAVDHKEGPNQFQIVGRNLNNNGPAPEALADRLERLPYMKVFAGAQKIAASVLHPNTWFVEDAAVDPALFEDKEEFWRQHSLLKTGILKATLVDYSRPAAPAPPADWRLDLRCGLGWLEGGKEARCPTPSEVLRWYMEEEIRTPLQAQASLSPAVIASIGGLGGFDGVSCCNPALQRCGGGTLFCSCPLCTNYDPKSKDYALSKPQEERVRKEPADPYPAPHASAGVGIALLVLVVVLVCVLTLVWRLKSDKIAALESRLTNTQQQPAFGSPGHGPFIVGLPIGPQRGLPSVGRQAVELGPSTRGFVVDEEGNNLGKVEEEEMVSATVLESRADHVERLQERRQDVDISMQTSGNLANE